MDLKTSYVPFLFRFLNIRLDGIKVLDEARHPHMMAVKNCFIRGSVVRYVQLPQSGVDTQLLEDATRRGMKLILVTACVADGIYSLVQSMPIHPSDERRIRIRSDDSCYPHTKQ